jgi:hypothetical protein
MEQVALGEKKINWIDLVANVDFSSARNRLSGGYWHVMQFSSHFARFPLVIHF